MKHQKTMYLDLSKKPGDPDTVLTDKEILEENYRLRNEIAMLKNSNSAAMRAALEIAHDYFDAGDTPRTDAAIAVEAALSSPPRNCDVGTTEEQKHRFKEYCDRHFDWIKYGCKNCPARSCIEGWDTPYCQLKWAQMPYEDNLITTTTNQEE